MYENDLRDVLALNTGALIIGQQGLPMLDDVLSYIAEKLNFKKERLSQHPDFLMIGAQDGKKSIGVDTADLLIRKSLYAPTIADTIYLVVDGIDLFTEQAQNRVLKLFEDGTNVTVIAISYGGRLLPTICSRLLTYRYHKLPFSEFKRYCSEHEVEHPTLWYYICDGCPTLITELLPLTELFLSLKDAVDREDKKALFEALSLVKEKDADTDRYAGYYEQIFSLLANLYLEKLTLWLMNQKQFTLDMELIVSQNHMSWKHLRYCVNLCTKNRSRCLLTSYTKENFFLAICSLFHYQKED